MAGQPGFFDMEERLRKLSSKGDDLERLKRLVDFELFRADLEEAVPRANRCKGGRPPFVWAHTAYRSAKNEEHLTRHGFARR
jgi:transposase, IS5 family